MFLFQLHAEVHQLKQENEQLTEMADKAEYFAGMLKVRNLV